MGPSVKLVLPIIDAFPNQKNWGNFLCGKKGHKVGGCPRVFYFFDAILSFLNISLSAHTPNSSTSFKWWLKNRNSYVMYCGVS